MLKNESFMLSHELNTNIDFFPHADAAIHSIESHDDNLHFDHSMNNYKTI